MPLTGHNGHCPCHTLCLQMHARLMIFHLLACLGMVCWPFAALAQSAGLAPVNDLSLYEAQVVVTSQTPAAREAGLAQALRMVLSKLSGQAHVLTDPALESALSIASDLVENQSYRQQQVASASGAPSFKTLLVARFRQLDVDDLLNTLGLRLWPQPRPQPVLWLAIDDGSGPRLVGVQQANAARSLLDQAIQRGFSLGLPQGSASEQALANALWRQDSAAVQRAAMAYESPMQLLGKLYRSGSGWTADWIFIDSGVELARWSSQDTDPRRAMAEGANGAANALVAHYVDNAAMSDATSSTGMFRIRVNGISSSADYLRLSSTLQALSVVRAIVPVRSENDWLELDLQLLTGLAGFNRMLGSNSLLQALPPVDMDLSPAALEPAQYQFQPRR